MLATIGKRLLAAIPTILLASVVVFLLVQIIPGDPAVTIAGESATHEQVAAIRDSLGLNESLVEQYWSWLTHALQGDLGESLFTHEPVLPALLRTLPVTLTIVVLAFIIAVVVGIVAGVLAGWRANSWIDRIVSALAAIGHSLPSFWFGLILVTSLALTLGLFPASGSVSPLDDLGGAIGYSILPATAMGVVGAAEVARQVRGAMITAMQSDAVRTHRAKGLPQKQVVFRAFKNCAVPTLTIAGLVFNSFLGTTVVIEAVFGVGGLGGQIVTGTLQKDYPIIQGVVLITAAIVIVVNLVVDILYRVADPRTR
ncbi:ABC transporter permease [Cumulibacter manganitolerans]|uniref:ABC transporter permease n=1 Tax=Cumulibacter manganitolerans TaxID=1884992 RepID=UPI0012950F2F|nr:ABC transporter permease [Cumulibacter manganitolerans]